MGVMTKAIKMGRPVETIKNPCTQKRGQNQQSIQLSWNKRPKKAYVQLTDRSANGLLVVQEEQQFWYNEIEIKDDGQNISSLVDCPKGAVSWGRCLEQTGVQR